MCKAEQDKQLAKYACEAQKHPLGSLDRRLVLDKLIRIVMNSGRLYRPPKSRLPPQCQGAYREICDDALQALMLWVCQNIDRYDPDQASFIGWLNMLMDRRFVNIGIRQFQDGRERRLGNRRRLQDLTRAEEDIPAPEPRTSDYTELRLFILEDPKRILQAKTLRDRPDITFQILLLRRLEDQTWDDMAKEFGISLPTLHAFFRRSLKSLSSDLREYLAF